MIDLSKSNFPHAFFKMTHSRRHFEHLLEISSPLCQDFYKLSWIDGSDFPSAAHLGDPSNPLANKQLVYEPVEPIPDIFSLIIGDALHNLRSALDYAATKVVRDARENTAFVTFPFHETRENLVPAQTSGLKALKAALPNADVQAFFQDVIKSYKDGNYPLWALTKLDKIDKHNALIPNVNLNEAKFSGFTDGSARISDLRINYPAQSTFSLISVLKERPISANIHLNVNTTFSGEYFTGENVLETIELIGEATSSALIAFDDFVTKAKSNQ